MSPELDAGRDALVTFRPSFLPLFTNVVEEVFSEVRELGVLYRVVKAKS
jgi:hypothetical protein